jgi:hypothetical protein
MSDWPVWFRCYGEGLIGGHKFNGFWHHHFYVVLLMKPHSWRRVLGD